jgi:hypothetical protein
LDLKLSIGLTHINLGKFEDARESIGRALVNVELKSKALAYLGYIKLQEGKAWDAIEDFENARESNPYDTLSLYYEGLTYFYNKKFDLKRAMNQLDLLLEKHVTKEALLAKAYLLLEVKEFKESTNIFKLSLELNKRDSEAISGLGDVALAQLNDPHQALGIELYDQAIAINPHKKKFYLKKGIALKHLMPLQSSIFYYYKAFNLKFDIDGFFATNQNPEKNKSATIEMTNYFLTQYQPGSVKKEIGGLTEINIDDDVFNYFSSFVHVEVDPFKEFELFNNIITSLKVALKFKDNAKDLSPIYLKMINMYLLLKNQDNEIITYYNLYHINRGVERSKIGIQVFNYLFNNKNFKKADNIYKMLLGDQMYSDEIEKKWIYHYYEESNCQEVKSHYEHLSKEEKDKNEEIKGIVSKCFEKGKIANTLVEGKGKLPMVHGQRKHRKFK